MNRQNNKSLIDETLPLIDLHRHLDGNVRLETILDLGRKHNLPLPAWDVDGLRKYVQVVEPQPGVMAFIEKFKWLVGVLTDLDACYRVAYENIEDAKKEGLDYVELRFSPWFMAQPHQLNPRGVVEAVISGFKDGARDMGIKANLLGIISRTYGVETAWKELDALMAGKDVLVGLDLAGDEANFPARWFEEHFKKARDIGWHITIHAGEASGAESVWEAIRYLGAERIGHAVHAVQDADLIRFMVEHRIGVEANLTSNLQTMTVKDLKEHPVKQFLEAGVLVALCTDDPSISNIDLHHEFNIAAPEAGLTKNEISVLQRNALEMAFLSKEEKASLLEAKKGLVS